VELVTVVLEVVGGGERGGRAWNTGASDDIRSRVSRSLS
jgi:hypothetical protein